MSRLPLLALAVAASVCLLCGCGTTLSRNATDQLTASDAVDRAIASIDFEPVRGHKIFLDTKYIVLVKDVAYVNKEYVISTLRQEIVAAGGLLQDKLEDADYVLEPRVATLGADAHEIVYGVPENNLSSIASSMVPAAPTLPAIPEMALIKKNEHSAAAKISVFAYDRRTKEAVWQSGIAKSESAARNMWLMGAGPFQRGEIYDGTKFAGKELVSNKGEGLKEKYGYDLLSRQRRFRRNKPPEGITLTEQVISLASSESNLNGVMLGSLQAVDPDKTDQHEFELVEEAVNPDSKYFLIQEERLLLKPNANLNDSERTTLEVKIRVKDAVSEFQKTFSFNVEELKMKLAAASYLTESDTALESLNDEPDQFPASENISDLPSPLTKEEATN